MTTAKTKCRECSAEILATTAESTGGLCMPCRNGTRKNIDDGKRYYEERKKELKKYDPWRELWTSLVDRAHSTEGAWMQLSHAERLYYSVCLLEGEVYNGGMHTYFWNSSRALYNDALSGLETLGAQNAKRLLQAAKAVLFGVAEVPTNSAERRASMKSYPENMDPNNEPDWCQRLQTVDDEFSKDPDGLNVRLVAFAEQSGLIQPYVKSNEPSDTRKSPVDGDIES